MYIHACISTATAVDIYVEIKFWLEKNFFNTVKTFHANNSWKFNMLLYECHLCTIENFDHCCIQTYSFKSSSMQQIFWMWSIISTSLYQLPLNVQKYVEGKIKNTTCSFPFRKVHHHLPTTRCKLWNQGNLSHLLEISSTADDWLTKLKFLKQQEKIMQIRQGSVGISVLWFAMTEDQNLPKKIFLLMQL